MTTVMIEAAKRMAEQCDGKPVETRKAMLALVAALEETLQRVATAEGALKDLRDRVDYHQTMMTKAIR